MPRDVILGTAGHIDHGKTALVRALTGAAGDRLPEEQARGITIDLGFAHLVLGDYRLGLVDVPGHERFVKNMLAGATGIEVALLVVAADDSVMPQTREHLAILDLLGVTRGVVAITKADLADATTREVVALEVRELLAGTGLADASIVPVSARSGEGIDALKAALLAECDALAAAPAGPFRLAIDRAFVMQGHGSVVTGSVVSGELAVGAELDWHSGGASTEPVRVRGLNEYGRPVDRVGRGQRAAVNLAGVPLDRLRRGQELSEPGFLVPTKLLSAELRCLADSPRPLKHCLPVRLHIGTAEVMATLSLLDGDHVPPGGRGFGQLFLDEFVTATAWQPFVLRDASAEETLGGGRVLHPSAPKLRRRHVESVTQLERLVAHDPAVRASAAAHFAGFAGLTPGDLPRTAAVAPGEVAAVVKALIESGELTELPLSPHPKLFHAGRVAEAEGWVLAELARRHAESPLMTTHDRAAVLSALPPAADRAVLDAVATRLLKHKHLVGDGRRIARADFKPKLSANQRKLKDKIVADFAAAGVAPPDPAGYLPQANHSPATLADIFEVACAEGFLARVGHAFHLHADAYAGVLQTVRDRLAAAPDGATVGDIRDWLGTTRKYVVPLCEHLDAVGATRRVGDKRVLGAALAEAGPSGGGEVVGEGPMSERSAPVTG